MKLKHRLIFVLLLILLSAFLARGDRHPNLLLLCVLIAVVLFYTILIQYNKEKTAIPISLSNKAYAISASNQPVNTGNLIPFVMSLEKGRLSIAPSSNLGFSNISMPIDLSLLKMTMLLDNDNDKQGKIISIIRVEIFDNLSKPPIKTIYYHANPTTFPEMDDNIYDAKMGSKHSDSYAEFIATDNSKQLKIDANNTVSFTYMEGAKEGVVNCDDKNCSSFVMKDGKKVCDCNRQTKKEKLINIYFLTI